MLCIRTNYYESTYLVANIDGTEFKMGDIKAKLGQFFAKENSKDASVWKILELLRDCRKSRGQILA